MENLRKNFMRAKQLADQNLGRSEKSEVLSQDLQSVEKRVDLVKDASQKTTKKIEGWLKNTSTDIEKRLKKMPETSLALGMIESANLLGNETLMGTLYQQCGECQSNLASHLLTHDIAIENQVLQPIQDILDTEIPAINKLKKQLTKATLDMDSLKSRWNQAVKQTQVHGTNMVQAANKADTMKEHFEDSCARMQTARDTLTTEMYNFIAREPEHSQKLLSLLEIQQNYHKKALEEIEKILPKMKDALECNPHKPVYGVPLEEHLRVTGRDVALVIEACIVTIIEGGGIEEEGLFRIAGMASKVKKLKTSFDAGVVDMDEYALDIHSVAGALKQYLRELPEPLLTHNLYSDFMKVLSLPQTQRLQALWNVVHDLPEPNYNNFRYLVKFLSKLTEKSDINKMTPSNIAIVIGPNLLWQEGDAGASMASSGSISNLFEMIVSNANWFFPEDIDFHQATKGSAPPRLSSNSRDNGTSVTTAVVTPMQASNNQSSITRACEIITTTAAGPITSHHSADSMSDSDVVTDNVPPSYQSVYGFEQPAEKSSHSSDQSPGDLAKSYNSPRYSVISHHSKSLTTNTNASCSNDSSALYTRSSSVPPVAKSVHSDVYSTMFALHSLGDGNISNYLTKVRGIWDIKHQQRQEPSASSGQIHKIGRSNRVSTANKRCSLQPEVEFGNLSSFCPPNTSRMSDNHDMLDPDEMYGFEEDTLKNRPGPPFHKSESGSNLTAPLAEVEVSSPRAHRRHTSKLKPAPPPPPERPYSIAVTASFQKSNAGQFQTWPRGAQPESNEEKTSATKTRASPDKPPVADKPGSLPHKASTISHGDRPSGPPPDRPNKPPPAAPNHQRSASAGSANDTVLSAAVTSEENGQGSLTNNSPDSIDGAGHRHSQINRLSQLGSARPSRPTPPPPPPPINKNTEETHL